MVYPIDNFDTVKDNILRFEDIGDFYLVIVLKRKKDKQEIEHDHFGIKHFFLYQKSDLSKIKSEVESLCLQNTARAYILPQRRSTRLVLWSLHDNISDILRNENFDFKMNHLIRTSVAGMHKTTCKSHKRWVIDIDADDEQTFKKAVAWRESHFNPTSDAFVVREYSSWIADRIRNALVFRTEKQKEFMPKVSTKYVLEDVTFLKTPHGFHIVTPPFNREPKAMEKYFGVGCPSTDWIKPDAMALLYAPAIGEDD